MCALTFVGRVRVCVASSPGHRVSFRLIDETIVFECQTAIVMLPLLAVKAELVCYISIKRIILPLSSKTTCRFIL